MVTILKLGGSIITDKDQPETVDQVALDRASEAISQFLDTGGNLVVVHGGGSFGHPYADKYDVSMTEGTDDAAALLEIHQAMGELTARVLESLHDQSVPALPVRPLSVAHRSANGDIEFPTAQIGTMLGEGFTPVINGDVVVHEGQGGTVLGGDGLVVTLADALDATQVGLCSSVPGVLDDDGVVIPEIVSYDDVADVLGGSESTDVTGGMAGKIRQLLALDMPASVFDLESLETFFETGSAGTVVR